jgi:hypothetical protein
VLDLPIHLIASFVWWFFTKEADEAERTKFEARLWRPPVEQKAKPIPKNSPWSAENEMKGFAALKAETGA